LSKLNDDDDGDTVLSKLLCCSCNVFYSCLRIY